MISIVLALPVIDTTDVMTDGDDVICSQLVSCYAVMCERKQNMHNEKQKASLG